MDNKRNRNFQRNSELEFLLKDINGLLGPVERQLICACEEPKYPVVLIVGAPRSGTTLMLQWLAKSGQFGYPSNLLSRFYEAPSIGARIQLLLTDPQYNFRNEILDFSNEIHFESDIGKTKGALSPNEFWYFWRRFIPNESPRWLSAVEEKVVDIEGFRAALAAVEEVFGLPFAMKGMILQYNIRLLMELFPKSIILFTCREPLNNIRSILNARRNYFGTIDTWYSVEPKEYDHLKELNPYAQVAGQVFCTNAHIEGELSDLEAHRYMKVGYESFCENPAYYYEELVTKIGVLGYDVAPSYTGVKSFVNSNIAKESMEDGNLIEVAFGEISEVRGN